VVAATFLLLGIVAGFIAYRIIKRMSRMKQTRESVSEGLGMLRRDGDRKDRKDRKAGRIGRRARKSVDKGVDTREALSTDADGTGELETAGHEPPR
jgi:hypothetical protein